MFFGGVFHFLGADVLEKLDDSDFIADSCR